MKYVGSVYFASFGQSTPTAPLTQHDYMTRSERTSCLVDYDVCNGLLQWKCCHGFIGGKLLEASCLR